MIQKCSQVAIAVVLVLLGASVGAEKKPVRTDAGLVSGVKDSNGVTAYLGIPFAAPPVGPLRWRPPQPAAHWSSVRAANHYGASCMQNEVGVRLPWTAEFMTQGPISEDCLYLNVWTTAKGPNVKEAVMFYIFGGGFTEGSGAVAVYKGNELAKKGVVVVTINYRVGPLGFLVHPELTKESEHHSSGNYGLLDQIAALHWVQRNIAAFGGDPRKVMILGQSAGAMSVADLMRSPLAQGLFARAIIESGAGLFPDRVINGGMSFEQREEQGVKFAESKGAHSLAELRALPASEFFKAAPGGPPVGGGPVIDGWVLTAQHLEHEVPVIVGMVSGDVALLSAFGPPRPPTVADYESSAQKTYGDMAATFLKLYPVEKDADVPAQRTASATDQARISLDLWSADQMKRSGAVYTYYFDHPIPWPAHPEFGAFHTSEVPYIFENLKLLDRPWTPIDWKLSETMSSYWSNFAKSGNPNGTGLSQWAPYNPKNHTTMELGDRAGPMPEAGPQKLDFFLTYLSK